MTQIVVAPRREDPLTDVEPVLSDGATFRLRISAAYSSGGQWRTPIWSDPIELTGSPVTVYLDAIDAVPYEIEILIPDDTERTGVITIREFRFVNTSTTNGTAWDALTLTTGPGAPPVMTPEVEARLAYLENAIASVSGGASNLANITDMSALARSLCAATTASAMRSILSAAAAAHTHAVADLVTTGTPSASNYLSGTGVWSAPSGAGISNYSEIAALTGYPSSFPPATHTHPATDISDSTSTGRSVLTAADVAAILTLLNVFNKTETIGAANLPANTVMFGDGSTSARPTTRTDLRVYWTASALPTNAIANDVWDNVPD